MTAKTCHILLILAFCQLALACSESPSPDRTLVLAMHKWGWADGTVSCADGGSEFHFSSYNQRMQIRYPKPIRNYLGVEVLATSYDVLRVGKNSIDLRMDNETRFLDEAPITWRIQFDDLDSYYWEINEYREKYSSTDEFVYTYGPVEKCG